MQTSFPQAAAASCSTLILRQETSPERTVQPAGTFLAASEWVELGELYAAESADLRAQIAVLEHKLAEARDHAAATEGEAGSPLSDGKGSSIASSKLARDVGVMVQQDTTDGAAHCSASGNELCTQHTKEMASAKAAFAARQQVLHEQLEVCWLLYPWLGSKTCLSLIICVIYCYVLLLKHNQRTNTCGAAGPAPALFVVWPAGPWPGIYCPMLGALATGLEGCFCAGKAGGDRGAE